MNPSEKSATGKDANSSTDAIAESLAARRADVIVGVCIVNPAHTPNPALNPVHNRNLHHNLNRLLPIQNQIGIMIRIKIMKRSKSRIESKIMMT